MLVYKRWHVKTCLLNNLSKAENVFYIGIEGLFANHVEVGTSSHLLSRHAAELCVVQTDSHSIVDISPLRRHVRSVTVVRVSLQEVRSLVEILEDVVFSKLAVRARLPSTKLGESLLGRDFFAGTQLVQVLGKHFINY